MENPKFGWIDNVGKAVIQSATMHLPIYRCVKCTEYVEYADYTGTTVRKCGGEIISYTELIRFYPQ